MEFDYLASAYVGDTITCTVTMTDQDEERRLIHGTVSYVNQDGAEVLRARFSGFPRTMRLRR
jgi:acyl dehydratase